MVGAVVAEAIIPLTDVTIWSPPWPRSAVESSGSCDRGGGGASSQCGAGRSAAAAAGRGAGRVAPPLRRGRCRCRWHRQGRRGCRSGAGAGASQRPPQSQCRLYIFNKNV